MRKSTNGVLINKSSKAHQAWWNQRDSKPPKWAKETDFKEKGKKGTWKWSKEREKNWVLGSFGFWRIFGEERDIVGFGLWKGLSVLWGGFVWMYVCMVVYVWVSPLVLSLIH